MSGNDLGQYILHEPSNITMTYIRGLLETEGIKKNDIPIFIIHFLCSHSLTDNIWVIQQVKDYFTHIENCKPNVDKDKISKLFYGVCNLLATGDKHNFVFINEHERAEVFRNDVMTIMIHSAVATFDDLVQLENVVSEEVYKLLCILYDNMLYAVETKDILQKTFIILRYLFALTPKHYLQHTSHKMDIIDIVFLICIIYSNDKLCQPALREYIVCMKDIFYFKLRKKDKRKRINILFYLFHVIINKQVNKQEIDYDGYQYLETLRVSKTIEKQSVTSEEVKTEDIEEPTEKEAKVYKKDKQPASNEQVIRKCRYLYLLTEKDEQLEIEMRYERERQRMMNQLYKVKTKEIDVDYLLTKDPRNNVNVTRLQY